MRQLIGIFLTSLIMSALVFAQGQKPATSKEDEEVGKVIDQFLQAVRSKRLDDISQMYASDGSIVGGNGRITGRAEIRNLWERILARYTSETTLTRVHIERSGNLAYESGDFQETSVSLSDGKKRDVKGTYLMVFRHQRGGSWLIVEQLWIPQTSASK
jgi:uncharacterized protein (TIGR02246 family)